MAMACDIIIAADHAKLGLPEPKVGLMAGAGGVHRLPRQVPLKLAMGMILSARLITAQEAYRIGLVNEVVPLKDLMATVNQWAEDILACSPLSIRASKEALIRGLGMPLEAALASNFWGQQLLHQSEDYIEGPRAFAEKRPPQWKGR
jgi:enoyl-CoA hydratase/carnithine racemase